MSASPSTRQFTPLEKLEEHNEDDEAATPRVRERSPSPMNRSLSTSAIGSTADTSSVPEVRAVRRK